MAINAMNIDNLVARLPRVTAGGGLTGGQGEVMSGRGAPGPLAPASTATGGSDRSFGAMVESAIDRVNGFQTDADQKVESFLLGEDVPVHDVMVEVGKADTSMRLMTAVMGKAIAAYNEVARLQI